MNSKHIRRLITLFLVVILWTVFALTTENFVTERNTFMLLKETAFTGLIALGCCFVMVGGGIDLSAGGIVCATAILTARVSFIPGIPGFAVLIAAAIIGGIMGGVNALLVVRFKLTEFVSTLATGFVYSGLALLTAFHGETGTLISKSIENKGFLEFGKKIGSVYPITLFWVILSILAFLLFTYTKFGVHTYAMGSNNNAASMSGVPTKRMKAAGFIICGACAGLAAGLQVAYQTAANTTLGGTSAFEAIAACVVGGVVLGGGKGDPIGTLLGSLFMCLILNGLSKFGLSAAYQYIFEGIIIILATCFDSAFSSLMKKREAKAEIRKLEKAGGLNE